ncbi:MAG: ADP-ribosylglycohydrolase family protein [Pseudomonadota bacterium]
MKSRETQVRRSAIWAAYGDALGFITELADADRVAYRAGRSHVETTVAWRRKVGGRAGATLDFPAGVYSDDTQLRLATCRAIRSDGSFDVAAFAKVELTAWANYALGAGTGSKEAAANLARTSATWYSNLFQSKRASYFMGGGNGAAMRVQPHVWVAPKLSDLDAIFRDVLRNALCTHGHPRGFVGACFHAATLAFTMHDGRPPSLASCEKLVDQLRAIPSVIDRDGDLRLFWLSSWENESHARLESVLDETIQELHDDLAKLRQIAGDDLASMYLRSVVALEADTDHARGSGTKTALLAAFLAQLSPQSDPRLILGIAANCLGSDTDSIATMAGALIGATTTFDCSETVQDRDYIDQESQRLAAIVDGRPATSFRYPDLRSWKPARAAVDAVVEKEGLLRLNGIGTLKPVQSLSATKMSGETLAWFELDFGQTILARVRDKPISLKQSKDGQEASGKVAMKSPSQPSNRLPDLFANRNSRDDRAAQNSAGNRHVPSLDQALHRVLESGFDPAEVGKLLLMQVQSGREDFVERGIALTATILTAYEARQRKRR